MRDAAKPPISACRTLPGSAPALDANKSASPTPPAPNNTFSTSGVSGTMVMMMSAFCAASLALAHPVPPAAVNSWGTPLRECRKSLCPPLIRLSAMGLPMMSRPINPMLIIWGSFLICRNEELYLLLTARDAKDASLVYRLAFLRLALPQVRLRPAQSVLSFRGRLVFAADPALIADFIDVAEQKAVIDFAGPRLVTARRIGELHMRDQLQMLFDGRRKIAFHDLHVVNVVLHEQVVGADCLDEIDGFGGVRQEQARDVARSHRT